MKPLEKIDLEECYKDELCHRGDYGYNIEELIKRMEKGYNPASFRDEFLAITQLYFDGLIGKEGRWSKQKETMDSLHLAGKKALGSFYRGEGIDTDAIKEIFMPNASNIIEWGSKESAKQRHLQWHHDRVQKFGLKLTETLREENPWDIFVCITSGGFEPSFLAMDIMEKESLIPVRYSHFSKDDTEVKIPKSAPKSYFSEVKGKKILVIDDVVASELTLGMVARYVAKNGADEIWQGIASSNRVKKITDMALMPII